jgi:hypothetical protein
MAERKMKMNWINHNTLTKLLTTLTILLVSSYFAHASFAGEGDSPLEAYFLPHDTELEGSIGDEGGADYYKVIVPAAGRFVLGLYDIKLQDAADALDLYLFRTTQNSVGTGYSTYRNYVAKSTNPSGTPDIIDIPDLARGIYFVRVLPVASTWGWDGADYKIRSEFTVFPPVVSDDVGDRKELALPIVNQLPTNCNISGNNDADFFECQLPYTSNLTLSLTEIGTGGNVDLEVYTALGALIGLADQTGATNELLHLPDLVPSQYFIKVFGEGMSDYVLTAEHEFVGASDILDDVGDDLAHAIPLLTGNPSVFCLHASNTECDIFSIYQPEDGTILVDVYNMFLWDGADDLYVRLFNEYGNLIAQSNNESLTPESIEVHVARGQYLVGVYNSASTWGFDGAIYTINVETSGYDVGDAFNQAMQIHAVPYGTETYGYPYIGMIDSPDDTDFFQVVLKDSGFIYLEVDRMLHSNVDVQLFDAHYLLLQTSANLDTQSEMIYLDGLDAGVYFIKVYSPEGQIGEYRLTPKIGTPTSTISDDIGDSESRAFPLIPYRRVNGYVWNEYTSDYYTVVLEQAQESVRIHLSQPLMWDRADDIALYVYDASGNQIGFSDNDVFEDEIVEFNNMAAGVYYARVIPQRSTWGMEAAQYCIVVETDVAPLPTAELHIPVDVEGSQGQIMHAPIILNNMRSPIEISSMSAGIRFDPSILEPLGIGNSGLSLEQLNAQVRYTRSLNTISVSMNNFSTVQGGALLDLIFKVNSGASVGSTSVLTLLSPTLNGAIVPGTDGFVTVIASNGL